MRKLALIVAAASMCVSGCAPLLSALVTGSSAPPQAPAKVTEISRTAVDFALNSFDAALYGLDFAMDVGKIKPGSPNAKQIAAAGRKVMNFLGRRQRCARARQLGDVRTGVRAGERGSEGVQIAARPGCHGAAEFAARAAEARAAIARRDPGRGPRPDPSISRGENEHESI
jgi:hypothetical protein